MKPLCGVCIFLLALPSSDSSLCRFSRIRNEFSELEAACVEFVEAKPESVVSAVVEIRRGILFLCSIVDDNGIWLNTRIVLVKRDDGVQSMFS